MDVSLTRSGLKRSSRIENYSGCCLPLNKMINNKILALKYRPQEFKDLIGQEVITQTILNAIKINKTPNAYLLTGIRGVGKTTTARLIAKALNCLKDKNIKCSPEKFCDSCKEISNSNHIDILEMDAASKTGIDDIRELIENAKYSPTSAKYKIFIIDEVHMLSKQAFNGLLKTLEEPPPKLKFILATTEVKKIPVTILSRCQRFDLKRVKAESLFSHLKNISKKEAGKISDKAIQLIVKAAEGSVRDAVSLLDRALVSDFGDKNKEIQDQDIREMLGLADKGKILLLLSEILKGNERDALKITRELIDLGLDVKLFLNDILELLYLLNRKISLGTIEKDLIISDKEIEFINHHANDLDVQDINLFWHLTLKTLNDLNIIENENLTLEMYVMQLTHLKSIDERDAIFTSEFIKEPNLKVKEEIPIKKRILENEKISDEKKTTNQLKNIDQVKEEKIVLAAKLKDETSINNIKNLRDLIVLSDKDKEIELKFDLERNVKLISFRKGKIDISFNEKLNKNFVKLLTEKLFKWTGERWIISLSKNPGESTVYEKELEKKKEIIHSVKDGEEVKKILKAFPDAQITDVTEEEDA